MEKKVEMSEFFEVIDSDKYKESEGNISSNIEYLLIYRIRKFYGPSSGNKYIKFSSTVFSIIAFLSLVRLDALVLHTLYKTPIVLL